MNQPARSLSTLLGIALVCGCARIDRVESTLDMRTGITWSALEQPVAMAHDMPALSTAARKYMYLGPVEMNDMGARQNFLWLGMGATLERVIIDGDPVPQALLLEVDGTPFELPLTEWDSDIPYSAPAPIRRSLKARVTLDQIVRIASATSVRAVVVLPDGSTEPYEHWNGMWSGWTEFRDAVDPFGATSGPLVRN